jgi:hypothetical protein
MKVEEESEKRLPSVYLKAKGPGFPTSRPGSDPSAESLRGVPAVAT